MPKFNAWALVTFDRSLSLSTVSSNKFRHGGFHRSAASKPCFNADTVALRVILAGFHLPCEGFNVDLDADNGVCQATGKLDRRIVYRPWCLSARLVQIC